jgi:hypothetical protein
MSAAVAVYYVTALSGQFPDHKHRNLKTFREHIRAHVFYCFVAE